MPINQSWRRKTSTWRLSILPVNILHILAEAGVIEMKATLLQMNANETSFQNEGEEKKIFAKKRTIQQLLIYQVQISNYVRRKAVVGRINECSFWLKDWNRLSILRLSFANE
ncbi:hypothetical protein TNIN_52911 [Trichonephila inaurata madagascariensis]|uniref:Uncharacterized protein n=1 Tax=Trichonephila inaurata madagascariensis TaxID=2747483 RepID=A0A8X6XW16_9ARAC|nr:hypothetical protein TNIN_52911 [Trichonephila inaurata madagascariensis]